MEFIQSVCVLFWISSGIRSGICCGISSGICIFVRTRRWLIGFYWCLHKIDPFWFLFSFNFETCFLWKGIFFFCNRHTISIFEWLMVAIIGNSLHLDIQNTKEWIINNIFFKWMIMIFLIGFQKFMMFE